MSSSEKTAYPLCWPDAWPRTARASRQSSNFSTMGETGRRGKSMLESVDFLESELQRLGARDIILSTNVRLTLRGVPQSNLAQPADSGAAVYFQFKDRPLTLACDKWLRVEDNVYAIGKHIEALRGQKRWGVGSIEQAFRGYMGLPGVGQSSGISWWQVLGVPINSDADQVRAAYTQLAKKHHPDVGGDPELFRRLNEAWDQFKRVAKAA